MFTILTKQKGKIYNGRKITNNSTYIILKDGIYAGEVRTKKDAIAYIETLKAKN